MINYLTLDGKKKAIMKNMRTEEIKEMEDWQVKRLLEVEEKFKKKEFVEASDEEKIAYLSKRTKKEKGEEYIEDINEWIDVRNEFKNKRTPEKKIRWVAAKLLMRDNHIYSVLNKTMYLYLWEKGIYTPEGEKHLRHELGKELRDVVASHDINEIIDHVRRDTFTNGHIPESDKEFVCVENGILNLMLEPPENFTKHNPYDVFIQRLPVIYNPDADCPKIKEFLSQIVDESDREALEEMAGYCLWRNYPIHKAFMFVGDGANGKSTYLKLLKNFLGEENCASIPLQDFERNRFAVSFLKGKFANIHSEISANALKSTGKFKMLTGGDIVGAEEKFKEHMTFENYAKMIFACNQIPAVEDESGAYFRRWIIVNFPNKFEGKDANKNLIDELCSEEELSGFLNLAIDGLRRVLREGGFSNEKKTEEIRDEYIRMSDPVWAFAMDMIENDSTAYIVKKELYLAYCGYCRKKGYPAVAMGTFGKNLLKHVEGIRDYRPKTGDKRITAWGGIKLKGLKKKSDTLDITDIIP